MIKIKINGFKIIFSVIQILNLKYYLIKMFLKKINYLFKIKGYFLIILIFLKMNIMKIVFHFISDAFPLLYGCYIFLVKSLGYSFLEKTKKLNNCKATETQLK